LTVSLASVPGRKWRLQSTSMVLPQVNHHPVIAFFRLGIRFHGFRLGIRNCGNYDKYI
jgi:hypothetical protein